MDQHIRLTGPRGADSQLAVGAVHGVAGLEGDDARPAELLEVDAQLGGGVAQGDVVVVVEAGDGGDGPADVVAAGCCVQVFYGGVFGVTAEDGKGFFFSTKKGERLGWGLGGGL